MPLGMLLSLVVAMLLPELGRYLKSLGIIPICVAIIFFVNGYQTKLSHLPRSRSFSYVLSGTMILSLIISPLLGLISSLFLSLSTGLMIGLLVMSAAPSTLSTCIVMTKLANGRANWALMMTVIINISGVFSIPLMLSIITHQNLSLDMMAYVSPLALLQKLIVLVLIPFILGYFISKLSLVSAQHKALNYLPSSMVIIAVWLSLSSSVEVLYQINILSLMKIALATGFVHLSLMLISIVWVRSLSVDNGAKVSIVFTASQKAISVAVSVLANFNTDVADAILFCVIFHFIQLLIDSLLIGKIKRFYSL